MDLLLITPPAPRFTRESFVHLGPALLKSHLSSQGKQVKLIDLTARIRARIPWVDPYDHAVLLLNDSKDLSAYLHGFHREEIDRAAGRLWELIPARDRTARVIGFSVFSRHLLKPALAMAAWLQRHDKKKKIVFGGWLFSDPLYHDITAFPWANHVVSGPGEDTVEKLTNGEPVSQRIISEPLPLKTLPCPVFENEDLLWYRRVSIRRMLLLPYLLTRGCRHQCQFCPSSRAVPEFMPIEKASTELLALQETYAPDAFFFSEVNLNNQTMYLSELCQCMLDSGLRTPWGGFASLIGLSPTLIRLMAKAGCRYLQIGIESGSKRIRTRFNIFKVPNLPEVESILANLRAAGIRLNLYFMHGFPHENEREFAQSVDWLHRLSRYAATCVVSIFSVEPGTPIFLHPEEFGIRLHPPIHRNDSLAFLEPMFSLPKTHMVTIPFDEINGMNWAEKFSQNLRRQQSLQRFLTNEVYARHLLRISPCSPLYALKKKWFRPYFHYDVYL